MPIRIPAKFYVFHLPAKPGNHLKVRAAGNQISDKSGPPIQSQKKACMRYGVSGGKFLHDHSEKVPTISRYVYRSNLPPLVSPLREAKYMGYHKFPHAVGEAWWDRKTAIDHEPVRHHHGLD